MILELKNIKLDLVTILKERNWSSTINFVTPEVIVKSLQFVSLSGSYILDYFAKKYDVICINITMQML